jgi:SPP1 gp7 family putative phage head morphogenesis protein
MAEVEHRPFGVRFGEAIDYLKGKLPEASVKWDDLAGPVHAKVFTVAGSTSADLSRDLQQSLVQAAEAGRTITAFRKDFDAAVQAHGWQYKGKRGWRTSLIFDVNMRSAHMAGRWAQIQAGKDRYPYLQYRTAGDSKVRPAHRQWNGLIYPVDDPFWHTHYPPCGWRCRCTVRAYSERDLSDKGLQVSKPFKMEMRSVHDADGLFTDLVPKGIDPGWDHNVGQSWIDPELALGNKLARLPTELRGRMVDKTISPAYQRAISERWKAFRTPLEAGAAAVGNAQVLGFLDSATLDGLAQAAPGLAVQSTAVVAFDSAVSGGLKAPDGANGPGAAADMWSPERIDELPAELRAYQAVLWDLAQQELLVVLPAGDYTHPTIRLRPNVKTKFGTAFELAGLGAMNRADLADRARWAVLSGRTGVRGAGP